MHKVNNINLQNGGKQENSNNSNNSNNNYQNNNQSNNYQSNNAQSNYKTKMNKNDRPTVTYSDTLQTMDKVQEKLKGYERVEDIDSVEIGTPVRYITWKYGKLRFCIGGLIIAKQPTYC